MVDDCGFDAAEQESASYAVKVADIYAGCTESTDVWICGGPYEPGRDCEDIVFICRP